MATGRAFHSVGRVHVLTFLSLTLEYPSDTHRHDLPKANEVPHVLSLADNLIQHKFQEKLTVVMSLLRRALYLGVSKSPHAVRFRTSQQLLRRVDA